MNLQQMIKLAKCFCVSDAGTVQAVRTRILPVLREHARLSREIQNRVGQRSALYPEFKQDADEADMAIRTAEKRLRRSKHK